MELIRCLQILEIAPGATYEEAKESYRLLVKVWHPDKHNHDEKVLARATDKLKEINAAWSDFQTYYKSGACTKAPQTPPDNREFVRDFIRQIYRRNYAYHRLF